MCVCVYIYIYIYIYIYFPQLEHDHVCVICVYVSRSLQFLYSSKICYDVLIKFYDNQYILNLKLFQIGLYLAMCICAWLLKSLLRLL